MNIALTDSPHPSSDSHKRDSASGLHDVQNVDTRIKVETSVDAALGVERGFQFWMCMLAIVVCSFLLGLDLASNT